MSYQENLSNYMGTQECYERMAREDSYEWNMFWIKLEVVLVFSVILCHVAWLITRTAQGG